MESSEERGGVRFRMGEKTALIVDPEGKDGAIKREEEQKEGEKAARSRIFGCFAATNKRLGGVWSACRCPSLIPLCVFVLPCSTSADSFWIVSLRHR